MGLSKEELKAQMMAKAEAAIDKLLAEKKPADEITLTEIEQLALQAGAEIEQKVTQALVEASQEEMQAPEPMCPECGKPMHGKGRKRKRIVTESGEVEVERAYYYCEACVMGPKNWTLLSGRSRVQEGGQNNEKATQVHCRIQSSGGARNTDRDEERGPGVP